MAIQKISKPRPVIGDRLASAQQELEQALSLGMIGTWLWDIKANVVTGSRSMADIFGVDYAHLKAGLPASAFTAGMYEPDQARVRKEIKAILVSGTEFRTEYRTVNKDGVIRWISARGRIERDAAGKPIFFPGIMLDISDRKLVENNLSYLAKASTILSASLDYKKTLQTIAALTVPDIADWCAIEILDDTTAQLQQVAVAHKDPAKVKWALELRKQQGPPDLKESGGIANVLRTGKSEYFPHIPDELLVATAKTKKELKLLRDIGLTSVIIVPLTVNNQTVGAISLVSAEQKRQFTESDLEMAKELASRASLAMNNASLYADAQKEIQARKRLEDQLRVANEALEARVEERTAELEETNVSLQRSNQELQDFAYVASHDLQEPLRKIQAFGNLLETEYAHELGEGADYLKRMRNAAARMSALIEDILAFSRVTTKGRDFTSVDLKKVAREVMNDLEVRVADTEAVVEVGDLPVIHADAMQMRQLLQNLISNAIKFHRPDVPPHIEVSSTVVVEPHHASGDKIKYCRLEVEDNGLGFDEKYLDRIFAVFQRLHNRDSFEGTGIGLAVCRRIVERHGGSITAISKPGKGSKFVILLPIRHKKGESLL